MAVGSHRPTDGLTDGLDWSGATSVAETQMNLLAISRRADFGYSLGTHIGNARSRLAAGASYFDSVQKTVTLERTQTAFHESTYLIGIVSIAEALVTDLGREFLIRYPGHIKDKGTSLDAIGSLGSAGALIDALASKTINDWAYSRFSELVERVVKLFDQKASLDAALVEEISEIKATRDLFVHGSGTINEIYLNKAGKKARKRTIGEQLPLGPAYLQHAQRQIDEFVRAIEAAIPPQFAKMGKVSTFRSMWEATVLAEFVPFDVGWTIESDDTVRPK